MNKGGNIHGITVGEVLKLAPLHSLRVVAGHRGLNNVVHHATVVDAPDSPEWLRGNEFVLTNGYMLQKDPREAEKLIRNVYLRGGAALGIKLERYVGRLPEWILEQADAMPLPLIDVPKEIPWIDIIEPILGSIMNEEVKLLKYSEEVYRQMLHVFLDGGNLLDITKFLRDLIRNPVFAVSASGEILAEAQGLSTSIDLPKYLPHGFDFGVEAIVAGKIFKLGEYIRCKLSFLSNCPEAVVWPIEDSSQHYGYFVVVEGERTSENLDFYAIRHAATVAAITITKEKSLLQVERKYRNEFIHDLLFWNFETKEDAIQGAKAFGWDLSLGHEIILISSQDHNIEEIGRKNNPRMVRERMLEIIHYILQNYRPFPITFESSDHLGILFPGSPGMSKEEAGKRSKELGVKLVREIQGRFPKVHLSIGISRYCQDIGDLPKAYREAKHALNAGRQVWGANQVVHFEDLGVYRLLYQYSDGDDLDEFFNQYLAPLLTYDRKNGSELVRTLHEFIQRGGNLLRTAEVLYLHPNTLRYRLKRIQDLLHLDLTHFENILNVAIAFKVGILRNKLEIKIRD